MKRMYKLPVILMALLVGILALMGTAAATGNGDPGNGSQSSEVGPQCMGQPLAVLIELSRTLGMNIIRGTAGDDLIDGTPGPDLILGFGGNDTLRGRRGDDVLCGMRGRDVLWGGPGNDLLDGGPGRDSLLAGC